MFSSFKFWISSRWQFLAIGIGLAVIFVGAVVVWRGQKAGGIAGESNVAIPTIINGELVLPKLATGSAVTSLGGGGRLGIVSANLIGITDQQTQKVTGIRILGEMNNLGDKIVNGISPVVHFINRDGKTIGQKIGRLSSGWEFFGVAPNEKTLYDVTIDNPPEADKLEIILNVSSATDSALFENLKIASRSVEVKTATYQGSGSGAQGTESAGAGEKVQYYSVSGSVINTLSDPVSDITIYSWARDKEGKVFTFNRQNFKNDLLVVGDKVDFRILLLPLKTSEKFDSYEVAAWGKRYRLNL